MTKKSFTYFFYSTKMIIKIQDMNFDEKIASEFLIDDYRLYLKVQWLTYSTIDFYLKYLRRFINYSKIKKLDTFNSEIQIKVSYNKLFDRKLKNNTFDKFRKSIIKYYDFLKEYKYVKENYWRNLLKMKKEKSLPTSLEEKDIDIIYNFIIKNYKIDFYRYRTYFIFLTFINTWVRRSELVNLKKEDIYDQYIKVINWKWSKDRIIYITKKYSKEIKEYIELQDKNDVYLFCNKSWKKLIPDAINSILSYIKKWTWIKIHPHLLRHTYASLCVKRGINIYTLQQQLGHTDLKTTSIYLYLNNKENWDEIQKFKIYTT